jgi:HNH endonuclease
MTPAEEALNRLQAGGIADEDNLMPACETCNSGKEARETLS